MTDTRPLTGKVAFVTGGAQGIGAAISTRLAGDGATVVIGDLDIDRAHGIGADVVPLDVSDPASVTSAARTTVERHGHVDILVNNAGISNDVPTLDHSDEAWQRIIGVNLTGAFLASREFGRRMDPGAGIVNISSIAALTAGRPERHVAYDVSKAGVIALTRTLGVEWAPRGIRVNAVAPGYTNTQILRDVGSSNPEVLDAWRAQVPQGRLIEPAEIASVVAFLASDAASAITGQVIVADAGYTGSA
ncbi:SDR family NAD(P)-dependent oxidoreductase [Amycolatopsis sacchari]|uniref:SDR family NAD(P)-dependent oxidoreductase n=1 Tax=Amycolatopsis sacchari TaxID=115433 RepID=UPI003D728BF4